MAKIWKTTICPFCREHHTVEIEEADYEKWKSGEYIQNCFPYLTADQRELLQTGIDKKCWDETFKDEEADADADEKEDNSNNDWEV